MPKATTALYDDAEISVDQALAIKGKTAPAKWNSLFKCCECKSPVTPHSASGSTAAHFEHFGGRNPACSLSDKRDWTTMRYWVMKGNPKWYDWDANLKPGKCENWHTRFVPIEFAPGQRIFLWESSPFRRVIGLGDVVRGAFKKDEDGRTVCRVRYLTRRLSWMPDINLLRRSPDLQAATFLQEAVFRTIYPLADSEALALYRITMSGNPGCHVWSELGGNVEIPDIDLSVTEGAPRIVTHLQRERNPEIASKKKAQFRAKHGKLFCEACGSDFACYGTLADGLFEVHHRRPLSESKKAVTTALKDLAILCSNCHRVIHRTDPMISVQALSARLKQSEATCADAMTT